MRALKEADNKELTKALKGIADANKENQYQLD